MPTIPVSKDQEELGSQLTGPPRERPDDNWANRSANMKCCTCMWFAPKGDNLGRCRRRAPTMSGWPVMFWTDWCGDHKLNENAL